MNQPDDKDVLTELHAAMREDMTGSQSPRRNRKRHIVLAITGMLIAAVVATAGWSWYRSNQWSSEGTGPAIDEMQWTGKETLDFDAAKEAIDRWLADQAFQRIPVPEAPENANSLATGLSIKKAPLDKQHWYRSPPDSGEPFYVVTFAHSSPTQWENIRAEYLGCFVIWDYSGLRWNVDANQQYAESFLNEAQEWWKVNRHQWERSP